LIIFASFGAVGLLGLLGFCIYLARRRTGQYAMLVSEARDGIQPISIEKFSDYVTRLLESPNGHINVQFRARHYATVYIDASYVTRCDFNQKKGVAIVPEFGNVPAFIAASTPMENTCPQFLTMIAQQRCPLVINLDE
uniref:Tyrosine-protein phosphatase domain-containing protein n=1 Tax=Schistocephalus solidus TaxID=70667 RepID=A0A183SYT1_SCHSO